MTATAWIVACVVGATLAASASAQDKVDTLRVLQDVRIDQRLGHRVPLELPFTDHLGQAVHLGDYFGEKPVLLALVYYECPMLCTLVLNDVLRCLRALPLDVGTDFELLAVSIDPGETPELAAGKRSIYLASYLREGTDDGWHFLVGDEDSIAALTDAVGFRYVYDPAIDEYAHAAGIQVLTPDGELSRYFYGLEYSPRDVRLGLVEASNGVIGSAVDQILLFCYHYDPITGKYGLVIMNVVRLAGALTVLLLAGFVALMLRRDRKRRVVIAAEASC